MKYNKYQALDQRTGFSTRAGGVKTETLVQAVVSGKEKVQVRLVTGELGCVAEAEGSGAEFQKLRVTLRPPSGMREVASALE